MDQKEKQYDELVLVVILRINGELVLIDPHKGEP